MTLREKVDPATSFIKMNDESYIELEWGTHITVEAFGKHVGIKYGGGFM